MAGIAGRAIWRSIRRSPGTYVWVAVLFVTTQVLRHLDPGYTYDILEQASTNIHYLNEDPIRVLMRSVMWIDGGDWLVYFALYTLFHAPAERWLGTRRWLAVVVIAHVAATYISEGVLLWAINHGHAAQEMRYTLDYGVSYALAGVIAVLTYRLAKPWRYPYLAVVLLSFSLPLIHGRTFTDLGHFSAVLVGLACYPIVRSKGTGLFDPVAAVRRLRARNSWSASGSGTPVPRPHRSASRGPSAAPDPAPSVESRRHGLSVAGVRGEEGPQP